MKAILLVDDSTTILMSMAGILEKAGYQVEQAANGEEAMAKIGKGVPLSLIITDYHMPGMNGVQLIQSIRKVAQYRFLPILVLTTESQQGKRNEAKSAGATGWLVKPVAANQLLQVLKQVVPGA